MECELEPAKGSEQRGTHRPCVVVQNDVGNEYSPTTIVAPFTKQYDPDDVYPFEVEVLAQNTVLTHDSVADLSQLRTLDITERIHRNVGEVPAPKMAEVDAAIKRSLGL